MTTKAPKTDTPAAPEADTADTLSAAQEVAAGASIIPPADAAGEALEQRLRAWVHDTFSGGVIAQNVACWNALQSAIPSLRALILSGD